MFKWISSLKKENSFEFFEDGYLCNWHVAPFVIRGVKYGFVDQYLMAQKAKLFNDTEAYNAILEAKSPTEAKQLGRKVKNFDETTWQNASEKILKDALRAKFSQNKDLQEKLLQTGEKVLVHANPYDAIYSIGLSAPVAMKTKETEWPGKNLLGVSLMEVREELREKQNILSLAYKRDTSSWNCNKNVVSIDVTATDFSERKVTSFEKLKRFRGVQCFKLRVITFQNCPNLEAIDLTFCTELKLLRIINCPKLAALELSSCRQLEKLKIDSAESLRYLSIFDTHIGELPDLPAIECLNTSSSYFSGPFDVSKYPNAELLITSNCFFSANQILDHKHLETLQVIHGKIEGDVEKQESKSLKYVISQGGSTITSQLPCTLIVDDKLVRGEIKHEDRKSNWRSAALLLYGPWGVPPTDLKKRDDNVVPIAEPPSGTNKEAATNAIAGAIFGSAIQDMIGVGVEFWDTYPSRVLLNQPFDMTSSHPVVCRHTSRFYRGTPTDDTSQAVLIMRSLIKAQQEKIEPDNKSKFKVGPVYVNGSDFGRELLFWGEYGHPEHNQYGGLGLGSTVCRVISQKNYISDPIACSKAVWEEMNRNAAANGSVMRNAPCGCLMFWDEEVVLKITELFGKFTHVDPRCVFSCTCASLLQSRLIKKAAGLIEDFDIDETIEEAISKTPDLEQYMEDVKTHVNAKTVKDLELGSNRKIGYSLKAIGSAIWALRYATSFEDGMEKIISEGGDSDTNGAVVGAILGAKFGYDGIPEDYINLMYVKAWLMRDAEALLKLMNLPPPNYYY